MKRISHFFGMLLVTGSAVSSAYSQTAETALTQWMEGNFRQAKNTAADAIAADKNNALAYLVQAGGLLYEGNSTAAQTAIEKAIKLSPNNVLFQAELAECYKSQNNMPQAKRQADKALGLLRSPRSGMEYFMRASMENIQSKPDEALADFTKAIEMNPRFVRAYAMRAGLYFDKNQMDLALTDLSKATDINAQYGYPYFLRGWIYHNQQQYDQAIAEYTKNIKYDLRVSDSYFNRAVIYRIQKKTDLAIADYNKVLEFTPKDADVYGNRGNIYYDQQKYDLAMADYNKAIELSPTKANFYVSRGNVYRVKQQMDLAFKDHNKAIELNPKYSYAYQARGEDYYSTKEDEKAMVDFKKAVELDPRSSYGFMYMGFIHHNKQQFNDAIACYTKAIEYNPNNLDAYNNRAAVYDALGNTKQANLDRKKYSDLGGTIAASGTSGKKILYPGSTFDPTVAKAALSRGVATIRGRACSKYDGRRFDAAGAKVILMPVTPYLDEWYKLREKKESKTTWVYMSDEAYKYRIEAVADAEGRFVFEGLKPGKYFVQVIHSFNQLKTAKVYDGSNSYQNGPVMQTTNYYHLQDYTVERSARFEKFVEIEEENENKKITLTSGLIKSCAL
ncbi:MULTISPECIES: tetratricopeptide repeat protein [Niastella]|uniref:Tetratricopeptide repeat protein n=1 Tax=Niastella soli TaxID=2821487 RepID=A0ABS3YLY3_9BACT|nr:tetratricopeptide repeat protein [Niastella soli]MBO9198899.1 tetratricopeptide repeat protein [Niastella soli]